MFRLFVSLILLCLATHGHSAVPPRANVPVVARKFAVTEEVYKQGVNAITSLEAEITDLANKLSAATKRRSQQ